MSNILYISNQRLPTEKAYGIQIAKMCEAFGHFIQVHLVFPTRRNSIKKDIFSYYGVKHNFKLIKLLSPDFYLSGKSDKIAVFVKNFLSGVVLCIFVLFSKADTIYSRDELPLYLLSFFKKNLIFEAHKFSSHRARFYRRFKKANLKMIVISKGIKNEFVKLGHKPERILVAYDGVDLEEFNLNITKEEAREKTGLPLDKKIVMYAGHLFDWKGVDVFIKAAQMLPRDVTAVVVGGTEYDINRLKNEDKAGAVRFEGFKMHAKIPIYLKAADILILPNKKDGGISEFYTSPLKLFEYMASGKPIIASNLPSIREVLNEHNAVLVQPNNVDSFAAGIKMLFDNDELGHKISGQAFEDVANHTWFKRAERILDFLT